VATLLPDRAGDLQSSERVDATTITIVTWNVQGSAGLDVAGVAEILTVARPDVVAIQEIGWGQARRLARRLGMASAWTFKHWGWPLPEGLALLTRHRLVDSSHFVLRRRPWWDWRRRVAARATVDRDGMLFDIINVHLSPHDHAAERRREASVVLDVAGKRPRPPMIAGDCNDGPDGPGPADFTAAGWIDAWMLDRLADVDGSTNWTAGTRLGRLPTQRLDYVFVPPGWLVLDAAVLAPPNRLDWFAERSDHLPLSATVSPPGPQR
jgi:endonuclease/exonuclease/phosphatase family metal-dependent hydrolase